MKNEKNLHRQFVKLGNHRRRLANELLALLPEIYESGIYKKYERDIFAYAGRFGGLGKSVVEKRLRLEKYVCDKPELRDAIRTEGVHKVALVASLATAENEWLLADKVRNMSKPALQELSKELRARSVEGSENLNLFEVVSEKSGIRSLFEGFSVGENFVESRVEQNVTFCKAVSTKINIELDEEMTFMFLKLKQKFAKEMALASEKLSNKKVMKEMMERLLGEDLKKQKNAGEKIVKTVSTESFTDQKVIPQGHACAIPGDAFGKEKKIGEKFRKITERNLKAQTVHERGYIQVAIRREKLAETGGKCAYPGCNRPSENFHHAEPVSEGGGHVSIKPLCKIHHEFMHNGLVENQQMAEANWQLSLAGGLGYADHFYRHYRKS